MKIFRITIAALCGLTLLIFWNGYGLRINHTNSLPSTLYLSHRVDKIQLNDTVTFQLPQSHVKLAKIVAGLPGDIVEVLHHKLYINGIELGSIVDPFVPIYSGVIPEGYFFALGVHPESFDSRYAEFGLVPQTTVRERLWSIF